MAKLPARQKVRLLLYRRANPDEILLVKRETRRVVVWSLPSTEVVEGESARDAALQLAEGYAGEAIVKDLDLGGPTVYRVDAGPSAGEWTEKFHAVEVAPDTPALEGRWHVHYDAKVKAGADAPRVRDAITRLRERERLKP